MLSNQNLLFFALQTLEIHKNSWYPLHSFLFSLLLAVPANPKQYTMLNHHIAELLSPRTHVDFKQES